MAAPTVYEDVADVAELEDVGRLFAGKKFWVAQRVPSRIRLIEDIEANGGEIVKLEKQADYTIADHFRKDCPPGSISYEFVDKSMKDGRLRDPQDHRAGPPLGESRAPGAINRPARSGRASYTPEEDRILYKWVSGCVANGGSASGNEIYKQLEAKYPRHTWQSWRDRYLKQLRNNPPSAFNIPDNAPPSPPSDHPLDQRPSAVPAPAKQTTTALSKQRQHQSTSKLIRQSRVGGAQKNITHHYTIDQLEATFSSEDWEELYAFVPDIDSIKEEERYDDAWENWAESQDNQTADQWRQYYEKVVRPQWLRDPEWKRAQINQRVKTRHDQSSSPGRSTSKQQARGPRTDDIEEATAIPGSDANDPSDKGKAPAIAHETKKHDNIKAAKTSSESKLMSSSTVQHESPKYVTEIYQNKLKRVRRGSVLEEQGEQPHPPKRQKSASPIIDRITQQQTQVGSQEQPHEISSTHSSPSAYQLDTDDEQAQNQLRAEAEHTLDGNETLVDHEIEETEQENMSVASDDFLHIDRLAPPFEGVEDLTQDDLPSDTPTPRASRQRPNNFDTQAILSSPSQGIGISSLPRPVGYTQDLQTENEHRSSSIAPHLESDASTTQSIHEFRRLSNGKADTRPPPSRSLSYSPAPSTDSDDPDPPLEADEFDAFYAHFNEKGFTDEFITHALKRTRCRPDLAERVLDAWKVGNPLPNQRGIWSLDDDEMVRKGDGAALTKLEEKHTLDGWGGITERLVFLEGYDSR